MGRIVTTVDIENFSETGSSMKLDALVDTGASYLTLPSHWKSRFGAFASEEPVELQTATQEVVQGTVCGPVKITVEGFRSIYSAANQTGLTVPRFPATCPFRLEEMLDAEFFPETLEERG